MLENIGEFTSISDFDVEYENEYEISAGDGWINASDTFYLFTQEEYLSSGEYVTEYRIVRASIDGVNDAYHPNVVNVAECATESERDSLWDECLEVYEQSMQEAKDAGAWR